MVSNTTERININDIDTQRHHLLMVRLGITYRDTDNMHRVIENMTALEQMARQCRGESIPWYAEAHPVFNNANFLSWYFEAQRLYDRNCQNAVKWHQSFVTRIPNNAPDPMLDCRKAGLGIIYIHQHMEYVGKVLEFRETLAGVNKTILEHYRKVRQGGSADPKPDYFEEYRREARSMTWPSDAEFLDSFPGIAYTIHPIPDECLDDMHRLLKRNYIDWNGKYIPRDQR